MRLDDSPEGALIRFVRGYAGKVEHTKILERTMRGKRARAQAGSPMPGGRPRFGYAWGDEKKTHLLIDEPKATIVRKMFNDALMGASLRAIADSLQGTPTPARLWTGWRRSTVRDILTDPMYTGQASAFRYSRVAENNGRRRPEAEQIPLPPGTVPPIIDLATFEAVQERLRRNKQQSARNNRNPERALLRAGFARCAYCGYVLIVNRDPWTDLYRCMRDERADRCPERPSIAVDELDAAVWARIFATLTNPATIAEELARMQGDDPTENDLAAIDRALVKIARQQRNYVDNLAFVTGSAAELVAAKLSDLENQKQQLDTERYTILNRRQAWLAAQQRIADLQAWCQQVATRLDEFTYQQKRLALEALGVQVKVWRKDHEPRYEITASIPLDELPDPSFVSGTSRTSISTGRSSDSSSSLGSVRE